MGRPSSVAGVEMDGVVELYRHSALRVFIEVISKLPICIELLKFPISFFWDQVDETNHWYSAKKSGNPVGESPQGLEVKKGERETDCINSIQMCIGFVCYYSCAVVNIRQV